jgi:hypothetical protein
MSRDAFTPYDPDLVDLFLGHLEPESRRQLEARLADDPDLQRQHAELSDAFAALDGLPCPDCPPGLLDGIRRRVADVGTPAQQAADRSLLEHEEVSRPGIIFRIGTFREVVAVAAMIVLAVGLGVPGLLNVREWSKRATCSNQLQALGHGMQQYAAAFNQSFPFAGWSQSASWRPTDTPGVELMPNRRHPYQLARLNYVAPARFVCPAQKMHQAMPADAVAQFSDFPDTRNISYAYQNMAGRRPTAQDDPDLVMMADENPLFEDGVPIFEFLRSALDATQRNSAAHGRKGQNVLSLGGHVRWATTPNVGLDGDNIWTLSDVEAYTGGEGPQAVDDSHMLK